MYSLDSKVTAVHSTITHDCPLTFETRPESDQWLGLNVTGYVINAFNTLHISQHNLFVNQWTAKQKIILIICIDTVYSNGHCWHKRRMYIMWFLYLYSFFGVMAINSSTEQTHRDYILEHLKCRLFLTVTFILSWDKFQILYCSIIWDQSQLRININITSIWD